MSKNPTLLNAKKRKIINIVVDMLDEGGLKDLRIQDICYAAGISIGAFYSAFPSKSDILTEMYQINCKEFSKLNETVFRKRLPTEALQTFADMYAEHTYQLGPHVNQLFLQDSLNCSTAYLRCRTHITCIIEEMVARGLADGSLRSESTAPELAEMLTTLMYAFRVQWASQIGRYDLVKSIHDTMSCILVGLQASS